MKTGAQLLAAMTERNIKEGCRSVHAMSDDAASDTAASNTVLSGFEKLLVKQLACIL